MKRSEGKHFEPEGVVVTPPDIPDKEYEVVQRHFGAFKKPMDPDKAPEVVLPEDIHPIRAVFAFDLKENGEPVQSGSLDSPVKVEVRWTAADFRIANEPGKEGLKLIIDYGDGWKPAPNVEMVSAQPSLGGVAVLEITEWGDPRVAWSD